jgi:hypothetical protein
MRTNQKHPRNSWPAARLAVLAALAALSAACATTPTQDDPMLERAQARWDAIIERDYDAAYALYSPGYRSAHSRTDFEIGLRSRRVTWKSASYREHRCEDKVCTVTFDVEFVAPRPVPGLEKWDGTSAIDDTWIQTSGEWWYVPPKD